MPLHDFLNASGHRVNAGVSGCLYDRVGQIWISKAAIRGVDAMLWGALKHCVDVLGLCLTVNSIDTGKHAPNSRHYQGRAVDINRIGPVGKPQIPATLMNPEALRLVSYLLANGFGIGERRRGQQQPGVLFGPVGHRWNPSNAPHEHHLHVSLPKRRG